MKAHHLLRVASVLSFLFAAGHSAGGMQSWSPAGETEVLRLMRSVRFDAGGVDRTYFEFYAGFGWTLTIFLLLQAVLLWQLASLARTDGRRFRSLIASFLVATVASALVSWRFILPIPVIFSAVIALVLGAAFFQAGKPEGVKIPR